MPIHARLPCAARSIPRFTSPPLLLLLTALCAGCVTTAADMQVREAHSYQACIRQCAEAAVRAQGDSSDDSGDSSTREIGWCQSDCETEYRVADWRDQSPHLEPTAALAPVSE